MDTYDSDSETSSPHDSDESGFLPVDTYDSDEIELLPAPQLTTAEADATRESVDEDLQGIRIDTSLPVSDDHVPRALILGG